MGSNAEVAEAGLNVENEFAELDQATATRMSREAAGRQTGGQSAMEMLTSSVDDGSGEMEHG